MMAQRVVFVTGLSGAGKSQTMKTFEDLGFYCVDNLPPALVPRTLELLDEAQVARAAVALDVRSGGPLGDAFVAIRGATGEHRRIDVLFLDARDETLVRRYSETRRRHPLAAVGALRDAIEAERTTLAPLRERATHEIDTTGITLATLKKRIVELFAPGENEHRLGINVVAFGFKYGIPLDLDLLFDVRFLRNPNYVEELQPQIGTAATVAAFIEDDPSLVPFFEKTLALLDFLLPQYLAEGKAQLTIGVGCTGGRHRSVYVAKRLAAHFESDPRFAQTLDFRDTDR